MPARRNNASTLLQKVNSQLRGERIPVKAKDEDELTTYLNNLTVKSQQTKIVNFEKYGDISISSEADTKISVGGRSSSSPALSTAAQTSRFLKKKSGLDVAVSQKFEVVNSKAKEKKQKESSSQIRTKKSTSN
uniref:Uncharacterized protein n=1 Tax=Arion vulgaris TaxID=1028688 RepID=A0A0B7A7R8_9EUPU